VDGRIAEGQYVEQEGYGKDQRDGEAHTAVEQR